MEEFFKTKTDEEITKELITQMCYDVGIDDDDIDDFVEGVNKLIEQRQETRPHETFVMWNFTKIEVPKSGDYVWVCNERDKNSKLIKWGTGDEVFYSYWMPADRPKPPQAT